MRRPLAALLVAGLVAPAAASGSPVEWRGDASEPLYTQYAAISTRAHCAQTSSASNTPDGEVFPITDSRFGRGSGIEFIMPANNSVCYGGRSELAQGNPYSSIKPDRRLRAGDATWFAWQAIFGPRYLASAGSSGGGMVQWHRNGSGKSPLGLGVRGNGQLVVYWLNAGGSFIETVVGPAIKADTVYDFLVHYETSVAGSFAVYVSEAGQPPALVFQQSGVPTNAGEPVLPTVGVYPGNSCACLGEFVLEVGGYNANPSREAAEAIAGEIGVPPPPLEDVELDEAAEHAAGTTVVAAEAAVTAAKAALTAAEAVLAAAKAAATATAGA